MLNDKINKGYDTIEIKRREPFCLIYVLPDLLLKITVPMNSSELFIGLNFLCLNIDYY